MKKSLLIAALLLACQLVGWSQAKKPTIMVVPADAFCERYGYVQTVNAMGETVTSPDYSRAMKENADIRTLVSAMADFMAKNDFPIQSLEQELKRLQTEDAEMAMMTGRNGGEVEETPLERLRRTARPDIILDLDYEIHRVGPQKQVSFNLQAIDAYSSKIISGNTGVSTAANVPMTSLLEECVLSFKDNFLSGLQHYFDDLFANGREVSITFVRYDNCPFYFDDDIQIDGHHCGKFGQPPSFQPGTHPSVRSEPQGPRRGYRRRRLCQAARTRTQEETQRYCRFLPQRTWRRLDYRRRQIANEYEKDNC